MCARDGQRRRLEAYFWHGDCRPVGQDRQMGNPMREGIERIPVVVDAVAGGMDAASPALHYSSDLAPGIRRMRHGSGFSYFDADGRRISHAGERRRIAALVIPPAWDQVWICPDADGHILATGRDSKGRKQYIYHPLWHELRSHDRFSALLEFGRALPHMRATIDRHLRLPVLSRERVLALVVRLLETTLIRIGNREYARTNESYGLTTLRRKHVRREGNRLRFSFRGKSGKEFSISLRDPRAANALRRCEELPGQEIFKYVDDTGAARSVQSQDVNEYIRSLCGDDFSAKDLRTWGGTVVAARTLLERLDDTSAAQRQSAVKAAVKAAARALGNTSAVARRHYIHPALLRAYEKGTLAAHRSAAAKNAPASHLSLEERVVLRILRAERQAATGRGRSTIQRLRDRGRLSNARPAEQAIQAGT
jgi:DNA topoisomerase-1